MAVMKVIGYYTRRLNEKTAEAVVVFKTKAIRKRKNCRYIRRTFGECAAANLPLRMFLALCHTVNLRRIVRTIYRSLARLPFEHIGLLLFRAFCIGFESWLHLRGSMWAGRGRSPRFQQSNESTLANATTSPEGSRKAASCVPSAQSLKVTA
jgi:hypothetical protein